MDGLEPPKAGLYEFRLHAIRALRFSEWATAEVALNAMLMHYQKLEGCQRSFCENVVRAFYMADFMRLADMIEHEFPVRFVRG